MARNMDRRRFIKDTSAVAAGVATLGGSGRPVAAEPAVESRPFASRWDECHNRVWLGAEYWANPLQDWRLADGRIECITAAMDRNVHLLVRQLGPQRGGFAMSVRLGRVGGGALDAEKGSAGFRIGIRGPLDEYRNNLVFGTGLDAGLTAAGGLFIDRVETASAGTLPAGIESVQLRLTVEPQADGYVVTLAAHDPADGRHLAGVRSEGIEADRLVGNVALVANFGRPPQPRRAAGTGGGRGGAGAGRFWFADWRIEGSKVEAHDDRAYGPILFNHYTLSGGILKMSAQMPPVGPDEPQTVRLQIRPQEAGPWQTVGEATIHPQSRTATFRMENWNDRADVAYRLAYTMRSKDGATTEHFWAGVVRRDPVDEPVLTVADVSCNFHAAFPNHQYVAIMAGLNPDLLAFVGDQFYESTGGYGVLRSPLEPAILDYLRKWYIHGWTWRELTRDRPSVSLPDDHDVYQGNVWGEGGEARHGTQEMGGYDMHAEWVNVVHRTQASHHPDPYDPTAIKQGISVYYGPMTYGRVSFAIIADRMFKTGPEGVVPPTGGRGDHVTDPNFDPRTADVPGAELLGERQMAFLRQWVTDWRGADMKAVVSQTIFTAMATTHGADRQRLRADYDANGWPQTARNEALRVIRKAFAVHLAGDQHLPAVVHYGVDAHRDAGVAFAGPAVNVGYPRWWEPSESGANRAAGAAENTGDFLDHFGHPLTVMAVANGAVEPRKTVLELMRDKASGLGLVRFDKVRRTVTIECWPFLADPAKGDAQFPGWPVSIDMLDNYGRKARAWLPTIEVDGAEDPVLEVIDERSGELVYALRIKGRQFRPKVFAEGTYTVRISRPETGGETTLKGLKAAAGQRERMKVAI